MELIFVCYQEQSGASAIEIRDTKIDWEAVKGKVQERRKAEEERKAKGGMGVELGAQGLVDALALPRLFVLPNCHQGRIVEIS